MEIDKLWEQMKARARERNLVIKESNGKEIIIDKFAKAFYIKCRAGDLKHETEIVV